MPEAPDCGICRLHAALLDPPGSQRRSGAPREQGGADRDDVLIGCFGPWLLRHHPLPSPLLGWLLLDSLRHVGGAADFDEREAISFGPMLRRSSALVRELCGCQRVYAIAFGEGARHLHMHLIPRHAADPASEAWRVADLYRAVAKGERQPAAADAVAALVERARRRVADWPDR